MSDHHGPPRRTPDDDTDATPLSPDFGRNPQRLREALAQERQERVRTGRPTKLTEARFVAIVQCVAHGNSVSGAAKLVGVEPSTVSRWMEKGRAKNAGSSATSANRWRPPSVH